MGKAKKSKRFDAGCCEMKRVVKAHHELCDEVNKLAEYIQAINSLPPTGAGARVQVSNEVTSVCEAIIKKAKSCNTLLIEKIYNSGGKV